MQKKYHNVKQKPAPKADNLMYYWGETTDVDIAMAVGKDLDIVSAILKESASQEVNESRELLQCYSEASIKERAIMDRILVYLCGWSMHSLVDRNIPERLK